MGLLDTLDTVQILDILAILDKTQQEFQVILDTLEQILEHQVTLVIRV